jgi:hypothetical protein
MNIQSSSFFDHHISPLERHWNQISVRSYVEKSLTLIPSEGVQSECKQVNRPPLVHRLISQQNGKTTSGTVLNDSMLPVAFVRDSIWIEQYPQDVRIVRKTLNIRPRVGGALRGQIDAFSDSSRRRLRHTAGNAFPALTSQFMLSYHLDWPDGRDVKRHLNRFLTWLRQRLPGVGYIWILEFQARGAPHIHLFLTAAHSQALGAELGAKWNRIAAPGDQAHLAFHQHQKNFMPWNMGSGQYLTKYLDKEAQKRVPDGFGWSGRFWGSSRNLVPLPVVYSPDDFGVAVDFKRVVRTLGKWHERRMARFKRRSVVRHAPYSARVNGASEILNRLLC